MTPLAHGCLWEEVAPQDVWGRRQGVRGGVGRAWEPDAWARISALPPTAEGPLNFSVFSVKNSLQVVPALPACFEAARARVGGVTHSGCSFKQGRD